MQASRGYTPINQGPLFDDDPGIMSEVETASTGFRRGGKQRSSLPVVRTPSKTLERPLGMVSHIAPTWRYAKSSDAVNIPFFFLVAPRFGIFAVSFRDQTSLTAQRDHVHRHGASFVRTLISPTIDYGLFGGTEC